MQITGIKLYQVPPRWLFLKVETDSEYFGWGEPTLEGRAETVGTAVQELSDYLIGKNPFQIEDIWQVLYRGGFYRGGPVLMSAISGIDQALWDIKGKALRVPVYELLGGRCRDRIRVYCWIGGDRPSDVARAAVEKLEQGYSAVKMNATEEMSYIDAFSKIDAVCERVAAIQQATAGKIEIAVDFHGRVHKSMAKLLAKALDPFHLMFLEEPVLPQNNEALREIARHTATPIATGERMFSRWDFKTILHEGYVDVLQPDLSHAGGISECKRIASMAEAYDVGVAPHCPLGPIALAACAQLDACTPNAVLQEQSLGIHYNKTSDLLDYLKNREVFLYHQGYMQVPNGPGLGIELDEEKIVQSAQEGHHWRNPIWRNQDGSVAEW